MHACPDGVPGWTDAWIAVVAGPMGRQWEVGIVGKHEIARAIAQRLAVDPGTLVAHMDERCRDLTFFPSAWAAAAARLFPQAVVTVNPDVFSTVVAVRYELDRVFDAIITSWEEGTRDKTELCDVACARLGCSLRADALLIDNISENCDAWRALGGRAYFFETDEKFASDLAERGWESL